MAAWQKHRQPSSLSAFTKEIKLLVPVRRDPCGLFSHSCCEAARQWLTRLMRVRRPSVRRGATVARALGRCQASCDPRVICRFTRINRNAWWSRSSGTTTVVRRDGADGWNLQRDFNNQKCVVSLERWDVEMFFCSWMFLKSSHQEPPPYQSPGIHLSHFSSLFIYFYMWPFNLLLSEKDTKKKEANMCFCCQDLKRERSGTVIERPHLVMIYKWVVFCGQRRVEQTTSSVYCKKHSLRGRCPATR